MTFLVLLLPLQSFARDLVVPQNNEQIKLSFAPLVKKVAPAVVNIYTKRNVIAGFKNPFMDDPFFGMFFNKDMFGGQLRKYLESALGSGVLVTEDGLVVTNAHVIKGAQEITISLNNGNEYEADVVLIDEASDLALLRVKEKDVSLPFVTLKPSESLEVGDLVLAIGNPFGVGQTVTSGIVSAQGRSSLDINDYNFFIQTDAAINPGNSGGPLVSMDGKVVGINTAIYSRSGGSMGIGFAIPSEMVASVIAAEMNGQVGANGIIRPWLGVQVQDVTPDIANSLGMDRPVGAILSNIHSVSPFKKAGVKAGDIVVSVNGYEIKDVAELKFRMATVPIGKLANVRVLRNGKVIDLKIKAIAPPDNPPRNTVVLKGRHALNGAVISNLNPAVSVEIGLTGEEDGVVVVQSPRGFFFGRTILPGDIIIDINGKRITDTSQVDRALNASSSKGVKIGIKRAGRLIQLYLR